MNPSRDVVFTFNAVDGCSKPIRNVQRRIRLQQAWDSVLVCAVLTFGVSVSMIGFALALWLAHWITQ